LTSADRERIGLLVLDVQMPGITGVDLLRGSRVDVIAVSTRPMTSGALHEGWCQSSTIEPPCRLR